MLGGFSAGWTLPSMTLGHGLAKPHAANAVWLASQPIAVKTFKELITNL